MIGKLTRGTMELVARAITAERKMLLKFRLQGRNSAVARGAVDVPPVRMPSEGRVVREAHRSWVSNDLANAQLGWAPAHPFELGARHTGEWMRFARIV